MSNNDSNTADVPREVLLAFFLAATKALKSLDETTPLAAAPTSLPKCRNLLLEQQRLCLADVIQDYNDSNSSTTNNNPLLDMATVQASLSQTNNNNNQDTELEESMESMTTAARLAFARLVLRSECQRTGTTSLNKIDTIDDDTRSNSNKNDGPPLETSPMPRSAMLEFCALGVAATRLECIQAHVRDSGMPLWGLDNTNNDNDDEPEKSFTPPMKRLENLQRLLLQAIGYDADMGLKQLARQVQGSEESEGGGNDDVELVQIIRQATAFMTEAVLGSSGSSNGADNMLASSQQRELLLSDQDQGGVTRVVSVQHSETMVQFVNNNNKSGPQELGTTTSGAATAPVSQSMRGDDDDDGDGDGDGGRTNNSNTIVKTNIVNNKINNNEEEQKQQLQIAREAERLRQSFLDELTAMSESDRIHLLQNAEMALRNFQERALQMPAGSGRIDFLRSMDASTKRLLTMHRIWQEEEEQAKEKSALISSK